MKIDLNKIITNTTTWTVDGQTKAVAADRFTTETACWKCGKRVYVQSIVFTNGVSVGPSRGEDITGTCLCDACTIADHIERYY